MPILDNCQKLHAIVKCIRSHPTMQEAKQLRPSDTANKKPHSTPPTQSPVQRSFRHICTLTFGTDQVGVVGSSLKLWSEAQTWLDPAPTNQWLIPDVLRPASRFPHGGHRFLSYNHHDLHFPTFMHPPMSARSRPQTVFSSSP